ncbi:transglycosylase SLT domain-containing protein [Acidomonas methanolica]|uniref:transglycosylase SLT domain-containing protein n=1 Tax=Acidomonas methanolica TaxID=437 RepID=UPI002119CAB2|nr:transglycosylase SLT domain-containing protein [Acidomonas methanolica]MCQ9155060.1 transglycosylase SLT domain-containing protein [Acidomonas methanolica]
MARVLIHICFLILLCLPVALTAATTQSCRDAVTLAEREAGMPPRLLDAVSKVESGRRLKEGEFAAWPWTINVEGQGYFYDSKAEAIAAVRAFQAQGAVSIDVGCMQINLHHHPDAFASLDEAFDPLSNARYGARFLTSLHARLHDWLAAAGAYHSLTPALGQDYARRVVGLWRNGDSTLALDDDTPHADVPAAAGRGIPFTRAFMRPFAMPSFWPPPRIIRRPATPGPMAANGVHGVTGRTLAAYRAAPVRLAWQP